MTDEHEEKPFALTADDDVALFQVSLPMQTALQQVIEAAGSLEGMSCLELGAHNAMFSFQLRAAGGSWESWATDEAAAARIAEGLELPVPVFSEAAAWREKQEERFDLIVVPSDRGLATLDGDWVERCHGLLKPEGRLIMVVAREKPMSLLKPFLGKRQMHGRPVPLFSEKRLFATLKCGFDVVDLKTHSRFFVEAATLGLEPLLMGTQGMSREAYRKGLRKAKWLYWLAYQLDALLFATKGHQMVVTAVQHAWRPRHAPVLRDGRSITEAVLKPIKT